MKNRWSGQNHDDLQKIWPKNRGWLVHHNGAFTLCTLLWWHHPDNILQGILLPFKLILDIRSWCEILQIGFKVWESCELTQKCLKCSRKTNGLFPSLSLICVDAQYRSYHFKFWGHMRVYTAKSNISWGKMSCKNSCSCQQIHGTQNGTQNQWAPKWLPSSSWAVFRSWLCIQRDVGRRPNGIDFFGKSPVFRDETFMRTNHKSSIPDGFGIPPEIMSQHVGIQRHRISKNSSTKVTLYNMLIDLCCLIPTYLIRTSTLKTNKAD